MTDIHTAERDSRLTQALALLDDTRTLLAEVVNEGGWSQQDVNRLTAARAFVNSAVPYIQKANRKGSL